VVGLGVKEVGYQVRAVHDEEEGDPDDFEAENV